MCWVGLFLSAASQASGREWKTVWELEDPGVKRVRIVRTTSVRCIGQWFSNWVKVGSVGGLGMAKGLNWTISQSN